MQISPMQIGSVYKPTPRFGNQAVTKADEAFSTGANGLTAVNTEYLFGLLEGALGMIQNRAVTFMGRNPVTIYNGSPYRDEPNTWQLSVKTGNNPQVHLTGIDEHGMPQDITVMSGHLPSQHREKFSTLVNRICEAARSQP